MDWIYTKLNYFNEKQRRAIVYSLSRNNLAHLDSKQLSNLKYLFATVVDQDMADSRGDYVARMIKESAIYEKPLNLYRVAEHESFGIRIDKLHVDIDADGEIDANAVFNFTGYGLAAREREDKLVISADFEGNASRIQVIPVEDLQLPAGNLYAIDILLMDGENPINTLDTFYLLVEDELIVTPEEAE
jgi:hypothetical protein